MPTTVTSTSGNTYHLFQLAEPSYWEPEESIRFEELENDLGDGYFSQALYGANTGLRRWKLKLGSLAHTDVLPNTVTDVSGATVSREEYLWNLFCHTKVTGEPFVFTSPRDGQYHLVRFADKELSYQKMRVKIYSTGVELKQVRIPGESVFSLDVTDITVFDEFARQYIGDTAFAIGSWPIALASGGASLTVTGDVTEVAAELNSHAIKRFNSSASTGYIKQQIDGSTVREAFLVMKMREATFSNAAGVFADRAGGPDVLIGSSGTSKFANPSLSGFTYKLNGLTYAQSDLQAPMNAWGVVHLRYETGWEFANGVQFGRDGTTGGTYALMDLAEIVLLTEIQPTTFGLDMTEYLSVKYGI